MLSKTFASSLRASSPKTLLGHACYNLLCEPPALVNGRLTPIVRGNILQRWLPCVQNRKINTCGLPRRHKKMLLHSAITDKSFSPRD